MPRVSIIYLLPVGFFLFFLVLFFVARNQEENFGPASLIGAPAPALITEPIDGLPPIPADALAGDTVKIVNFWASWCVPCRVEHPHLAALKAQGVLIYGVSYADKPERAKRYLDQHGNPYAGASDDPARRTALEWGVRGVPESFIVDAKGRVVLRFAGPITSRILRDKIEPALEKAKSAGGS